LPECDVHALDDFRTAAGEAVTCTLCSSLVLTVETAGLVNFAQMRKTDAFGATGLIPHELAHHEPESNCYCHDHYDYSCYFYYGCYCCYYIINIIVIFPARLSKLALDSSVSGA